MDVDAAQDRHVQHLLGQNPAVGHHGADVRLQSLQLFHGFFLPEILRLEHRNSGVQRHFLHRRGHQLHAPSLGAVRLGIDADHLKAVGKNLFQTGRRDIRRSHKHNPQGSSSCYSSSPASSSSVRNRSMTSV